MLDMLDMEQLLADAEQGVLPALKLLDGSVIPMSASGMGDGYYTDYWGMDVSGEPCELVIIFMNPMLFKDC